MQQAVPAYHVLAAILFPGMSAEGLSATAEREEVTEVVMGDEDKDGGTAFPCHGPHRDSEGMALRDYFAAAALQGMWAGKYTIGRNKETKEVESRISYDDIAGWAFEQADAMLKARTEE
jgi:hypothetical protein